MSKAFTKETETEPVEPDTPDPLPKGLKNYVTPNGQCAACPSWVNNGPSATSPVTSAPGG